MIAFLKGFLSAFFIGVLVLAFLAGAAIFCEWVIAVVSRPALDMMGIGALLIVISVLNGANKYIDAVDKAKEENDDVQSG
jgi:hypothetical protein